MSFFDRPALAVAPDLIGATVLLSGVGGRIVETEAYHRDDPASHSYHGPTRRNAAMFGQPGHVYVYLIYGMHWCLNFVCADAGAVLIRAIEPTDGLDKMRERRGLEKVTALCSGPGKLARALGVGPAHNGLAIDAQPFEFRRAEETGTLLNGPRVGITKAADLPWRFGLDGSPYLSRKF